MIQGIPKICAFYFSFFPNLRALLPIYELPSPTFLVGTFQFVLVLAYLKIYAVKILNFNLGIGNRDSLKKKDQL